MVAALDAFLGQTVPLDTLELIFVVPRGRARPRRLPRHKRLKARSIAWPAGAGLAEALNAGAKAARAPVLAVLADRWRPSPGFADYCLDFHARQPGLADILMPASAIDPAMAAHPLLWWLGEQHLYGLDPVPGGIHNWQVLRFDALSMKRELLLDHPVPSASGDERLMGTLWASRAPVRVFAEPVPAILPSDPPQLSRVLVVEYRGAYARRKAIAAAPQRFAGETVDARFEHPDRYRLSAADQAELAETIASMERELAGRHPRFAVGSDAEQFAILGRLYLAAVSHARSAGWADADAGKRRLAGEERCRHFGVPRARKLQRK